MHSTTFKNTCIKLVSTVFVISVLLHLIVYVKHRFAVKQLSELYNATVQNNVYVVAGKNNHLFYSGTLQYCLENWDRRQDIKRFSNITEHLRKLGIQLYIVPIPTKVDMYPELLTEFNLKCLCSARQRYLNKLKVSGIRVLDPMSVMWESKATQRLFPGNDSHWDQKAIISTANWLTDELKKREPSLVRGNSRFTIDSDTLFDYYGDLSVLDKSSIADTLFLDRVYKNGNPFVADNQESSILVYGDSFVKQYSEWNAGVAAHLSSCLQYSVASDYSYGNFETGERRILKHVYRNKHIKTVIWIFTSHSLKNGWIS